MRNLKIDFYGKIKNISSQENQKSYQNDYKILIDLLIDVSPDFNNSSLVTQPLLVYFHPINKPYF